MEKYLKYIFESIIKDVNNFETIFNNYSYLTWIIIWVLWIWWILIKYILLTFPVWGTFNLMFNKIWRIQITKINKPWNHKEIEKEFKTNQQTLES